MLFFVAKPNCNDCMRKPINAVVMARRFAIDIDRALADVNAFEARIPGLRRLRMHAHITANTPLVMELVPSIAVDAPDDPPMFLDIRIQQVAGLLPNMAADWNSGPRRAGLCSPTRRNAR